MSDSAPVSSRTRGRTDKIGEGRTTVSRSSSTDSDASARYISSRHSQADYSEDEFGTSVSQASASTEDAPIVRPPIGFQPEGQNHAQGVFGFGAFSQFGPNVASGFHPPPAQPSQTLPSANLTLPSKVYGTGANALGPTTGQDVMVAQNPVAGWNGFNVSGQAPFDTYQPPNGRGCDVFGQEALQQQRPTCAPSKDVSSQQSSSSKGVLDSFSVNTMPSFEGNFLGEQSHVQNASGEVVPQHTGQNSNGTMASVSVDDGGPEDYRAIFEGFFASAPNSFPDAGNLSDTETLPEPSGPPSQHDQEFESDVIEVVPEATPTRHRTISTESYAPSSGPTSDDDDSSDASQVPSKRKRGKQTGPPKGKMKKDDQRKRGKFRVRVSSVSPPSQFEPPMSTLPGKPIFTTTGPILDVETPLPYFEYKHKDRSKQAPSSSGAQRSSNNVAVASNGSNITGKKAREIVTEHSNARWLAMDPSPGRVEPGPPTAQNEASHPPPQTLPSAGSYAYRSVPSPSSQSVGGTPFEGPSLRMHHESEAILAERDTPPENHLVSVMITDKRFANTEPSLVELIIPLSPSGRSDYWLDTMVFCHSLQSGPSRIDGPAKAFVFRGRFRQYFLRVSEQNDDVYGPGNLTVPYNRFLNVTVESTVSTVAQNIPRPPLMQPQPSVPNSVSNFNRFASPNPSEASLPSASIARPRESSLPPPSTPAPSAVTNGQQPSTSNQDSNAKSYYRKRAL